MSSRKFENVAEQRLWIGNPKKGHVLMERFFVDLRFNPWNLEQGLDFGRKGKTASLLHVVARFDSEMISCHKQGGAAGAQVANAECEHTVQAFNAVWAFLLVEVNDDFSLALRRKSVPLHLQIAAQFGEIVDLTVVGDPDSSIFVAHGHVPAGGKVNDGKSTASKSNVGTVGKSLLPEAGVVGPAMNLRVIHACECFTVSAIN